jgi:hypothetical protein
VQLCLGTGIVDPIPPACLQSSRLRLGQCKPIAVPKLGGPSIRNSQPDAERSLDDPNSLIGASPEEIEALLPEAWVRTPSKKGGGDRWNEPGTAGTIGIRIMPGNPNDPDPVKQGPYVRILRPGRPQSPPIPLAGNPTLRDWA